MYKYLIIIVLFTISYLSACEVCSSVENYSNYTILQSDFKGKLVPIIYSDFISALDNFDVVLFGEFHDNTLIHKIQETVIYDLINKGNLVSLSFEMFERDVQFVLNRFLNDEINEEEFLETSRPWNNYIEDYKPLIDLAKKHNLPALAANIPRSIANLVSKHGLLVLDSLNYSDKKYLPKDLYHPFDDNYYEKFYETMSIMSHSMPLKKDKIHNFYLAQCLKDDTMAETIFLHNQNNSGRLIVHFNGSFHSDYLLGTYERLKRLKSNLKIAVISPTFKKQINHEEDDYLQKLSQKGHFLILID